MKVNASQIANATHSKSTAEITQHFVRPWARPRQVSSSHSTLRRRGQHRTPPPEPRHAPCVAGSLELSGPSEARHLRKWVVSNENWPPTSPANQVHETGPPSFTDQFGVLSFVAAPGNCVARTADSTEQRQPVYHNLSLPALLLLCLAPY